LHEGNAATDLYLDPKVEKTFVVVRIMRLIDTFAGYGFLQMTIASTRRSRSNRVQDAFDS